MSSTPTPNAGESQIAQSADIDESPPTSRIGWIVGMSSYIGRARWIVFCLFQFGMIAGLVLAHHASPPPVAARIELPATGDAFENKKPQPVPKPHDNVPVDAVERADQLLREGRFEAALAAYRSIRGGDANVAPSLRYKIATCLEGMGRWDQAIAEFSAVWNSASDPALTAAAAVGQTRVCIRKGQNAEAKQLVCDQLLRSGSVCARRQALVSESVHRLARLVAESAVGIDSPGPMNYQAVAHTKGESGVDNALDWISEGSPSEGSKDLVADGTIEVENPRGVFDQAIVRGSLRRTSVPDALEQLIAASGRQCLLTPQVHQEIAERTTSIDVDSLPLSVVVTAITEPLGVLWEVTDTAVHFCSEREVSNEALALYRSRFAERALRDALQRFPRHALAPYSELELGNVHYSCGRFQEAATAFAKLSRNAPKSPVAIEASYNLGLALRQHGDDNSAREAFYRVIDGAPGHELAPLACLAIGRMHLDRAEFDKAIPPLRRAANTAPGTDSLPVATLLLAAAYLHMNNAEEANAILLRNRNRLTEAPYRNVTAFLGSYARMLLSGGRRQAQREARVLMWAIVGASRESVLGPTGVLLMGHAYRELGLGEKMVDLYRRAIQDGVPPVLEPELSYDMADHALTTGDVSDAVSGFTELATRGSAKWSRMAKLRLAEIALDEGRQEECLKWCRESLDASGASSSDAPNILKLMGRAFEQLGVHQKAAICYAGQVPEP
jgi:tetratricopeptide (TPR) repeat protein